MFISRNCSLVSEKQTLISSQAHGPKNVSLSNRSCEPAPDFVMTATCFPVQYNSPSLHGTKLDALHQAFEDQKVGEDAVFFRNKKYGIMTGEIMTAGVVRIPVKTIKPDQTLDQ